MSVEVQRKKGRLEEAISRKLCPRDLGRRAKGAYRLPLIRDVAPYHPAHGSEYSQSSILQNNAANSLFLISFTVGVEAP